MAEVMPPIGLIAEPEASAAVSGCPKFGDRYEDFGCTVNSISVEELFAKYESSGFLYPAKRERLMPYMAIIMENWRRSMSSENDSFIHDVILSHDPNTHNWATLTIWATGSESVHSQHLVSSNSPKANRAAILAAQSVSYRYGHRGSQNWYRPENRFPAKIFGSCIHSLGDERAVVHEHAYLRVDRTRLPGAPAEIAVDELSNADASLIERLAQRLCGRVQARADEWETGDVRLESLDARYRAVGLRRFRRVFIARVPGQQDPIGFAVAYRGPLGLNFSFLENRCELWVDPDSTPALHERAIAALMHAAAGVYHDFELPDLLVTASLRDEQVLIAHGARLIQNYNRSIWLRDGYEAWYNHVDGFYDRIRAREDRVRCRVGTAGGPGEPL